MLLITAAILVHIKAPWYLWVLYFGVCLYKGLVYIGKVGFNKATENGVPGPA